MVGRYNIDSSFHFFYYNVVVKKIYQIITMTSIYVNWVGFAKFDAVILKVF